MLTLRDRLQITCKYLLRTGQAVASTDVQDTVRTAQFGHCPLLDNGEARERQRASERIAGSVQLVWKECRPF